ncbi:MAG: SRPBCC domain-containing protein [Candidatus Ozemobacteraceae bacterium]
MTQVFHLTASLNCTPEEAFTYFIDKKKLEEWLTTVADIEPRTGGKFELFWDPTDHENNSTIGCRITAMRPKQIIAFDWKSPKQFKAFANEADPLTHVVVSFIPNGNQTIVHLIHSGWRSTSSWNEARMWQEGAWRSAFDSLEGQVNKR